MPAYAHMCFYLQFSSDCETLVNDHLSNMGFHHQNIQKSVILTLSVKIYTYLFNYFDAKGASYLFCFD